MAVFFLPTGFKEQMELIQALSQVIFVRFDEKAELKRIRGNLEYNTSLNRSEKDFLDAMIERYGIYL